MVSKHNWADIGHRETPASPLTSATLEYDLALQRKRLVEAREAEEKRRERIRSMTSAAIQGYGHKGKAAVIDFVQFAFRKLREIGDSIELPSRREIRKMMAELGYKDLRKR
jgi:hypothetical protein